MSDTKDANKELEIKTNYPILVEQLLLLAKEFNACDGVIREIKSIKDAKSFRSAYRDSFEGVAEKFGIDLNDDNSDLEDEIQDLEREVSELKDEVEELEEQFGRNTNMWDEYKIKHFLAYKNNYTEWELEELLKNGRQFLVSLNPHKNEKPLTMSDNYILIGKTPKKASNIVEWGRWFESNEKNRVVGKDVLNNVRVSTVFLGIDHNLSPRATGNSEPILFETMIFGGKYDQYQRRYSTWAEAEIGHKKALEMIKPNFIMRIINWLKKYNS